MSPAPYDADDRLDEDQFAAKIGRTPRTLRSWRVKRMGPPFVREGKKVIYSWIRYLEHLRESEERPLRRRP
jgi:hypothetical protein